MRDLSGEKNGNRGSRRVVRRDWTEEREESGVREKGCREEWPRRRPGTPSGVFVLVVDVEDMIVCFGGSLIDGSGCGD